MLAFAIHAEPKGAAVAAAATPAVPSPTLPSGAEFTKLRMAFAAKADFNPYWTVDEERTVLMKAVEARDVKEIAALSKRWLARVPVEVEMHLIRAEALEQQGDWARALHHFGCHTACCIRMRPRAMASHRRRPTR